jgi:hypothetical protein
MDDANSDPLVSDLHFCSEAEFQEGNARLKILELREQGHPAFCNMKMIPPNARELPEGLLKVIPDFLIIFVFKKKKKNINIKN